jgi:hypothetical protein
MPGFGHIGQHAIGFIQDNAAAPVVLPRVSRIVAGGFANTRPAAVAELEEEMKFAIVNSDYSTVTIADASGDTLILDTEIVDTDNLVSLSGNNAVFALAGYYDVEAIVSLNINGGSAVSADGYGYVSIGNAGSFDNIYAQFGTPSGSVVDEKDFFASGPVYMNAGEYIQVSVRNETGHSLDAYVKYLTITKKS